MRAKADLAGAFQNLDALEAAQRRVRVGGVVAIGPVGQRQPVFEQEHFAGARRRKPAHADVGAEAQALFVAGIDARRLAQRLVDGEHARAFEVFRLYRIARAWDAQQIGPVADDHNFCGLLPGFVGAGFAAPGPERNRGPSQHQCLGFHSPPPTSCCNRFAVPIARR